MHFFGAGRASPRIPACRRRCGSGFWLAGCLRSPIGWFEVDRSQRAGLLARVTWTSSAFLGNVLPVRGTIRPGADHLPLVILGTEPFVGDAGRLLSIGLFRRLGRGRPGRRKGYASTAQISHHRGKKAWRWRIGGWPGNAWDTPCGERVLAAGSRRRRHASILTGISQIGFNCAHRLPLRASCFPILMLVQLDSNPTPLERPLVDRIVVGWLQTQQADGLATQLDRLPAKTGITDYPAAEACESSILDGDPHAGDGTAVPAESDRPANLS